MTSEAVRRNVGREGEGEGGVPLGHVVLIESRKGGKRCIVPEEEVGACRG